LEMGSEHIVGSELRVLFVSEDGTPRWIKPETHAKYQRRSGNNFRAK
jgi:hypothetical protein